MSKELRQAFNRIVMLFQRRVFRVAYTVVRNEEEADDITQEVFVKLFRHIDRIQKPESIQAWLMRTTVSTARDRLRWQKVRGWFGGGTKEADDVESSSSSSPEKLTAAHERAAIIERWTKSHLTDKEQVIFQMRFGEEMTIAEIAESLAMNINTVKTHLYRAEKKMRDLASKASPASKASNDKPS